MNDILGLHRVSSRISVDSIASFAENINSRNAFDQFCKRLYEIGVTEDTIREKENEILEILRPKNMVAGSLIEDSNMKDQGQLLG